MVLNKETIEKLAALFCDKTDKLRPHIAHPFYHTGDKMENLYATDGHLLIRIHRSLFNAKECKYQKQNTPNVLKVFKEDVKPIEKVIGLELIRFITECKVEWVNDYDWPEDCTTCPECDGEGEVDYISKDNLFYRIDCPVCNGEGYTGRKVLIKKYLQCPVQIGDKTYDASLFIPIAKACDILGVDKIEFKACSERFLWINLCTGIDIILMALLSEKKFILLNLDNQVSPELAKELYNKKKNAPW